MSQTRHIDAVCASGVESIGLLADAYYADLSAELGEHPEHPEHPEQLEAFDRLLDYLTSDDPSQVWHAAMLGFGLGLAEDAEARAFIEEAAGAFLMIATPGDFPEGCPDA